MNNISLLVASEPGTDFLGTLAAALRDNPLVTLIGWSLATFGAGFAARKYFQDRELDRVKTALAESLENLQTATAKTRAFEAKGQDWEDCIKTIADCLNPADVKKNLAGPLSHWPAEKHDLLVAGVMRQLISTPGRAWLCTPRGTSLVMVDWDEQRHACRVGSETNSQVDPIKELREFVTDVALLETALFDIAVHGITSVAVRSSPSTLETIHVRQGPGLSWHVEKRTLARVGS